MHDHQLIDLTHFVHDRIPTWNGSCGFHHEVKLSYEKAGICVQKFEMHAGVGTHMDAPSHFFEEGKCIGDIELNVCVVPLICLDVSHEASSTFFLSHHHILRFEKEHGPIPSGAFFALHTGWSRYWDEATKYRNTNDKGEMEFPGYSIEAAKLLLERGVVGIGIDTLSPDGSNTSTFPVHRHILGAGCYIIENMANLHRVPSTGASVANLPMKIEVGSECAVRSVAFVLPSMI